MFLFIVFLPCPFNRGFIILSWLLKMLTANSIKIMYLKYTISIKIVMILWNNIRLWSEQCGYLSKEYILIEDRLTLHFMRRWFVSLKLLRFMWWIWISPTLQIIGNNKDSITYSMSDLLFKHRTKHQFPDTVYAIMQKMPIKYVLAQIPR